MVSETESSRMNWRSGLFRAWIFGAVCWVAFVGWLAYGAVFVPGQTAARLASEASANFDACADSEKHKQGGTALNCASGVADFDSVPAERPAYIEYLVLGIVPPIAILGLWLAVTWIAVGFTSQSVRSD